MEPRCRYMCTNIVHATVVGANYRAPEINTSEIIVDLQLHVQMNCHLCDIWCEKCCPETET